MERGDIFIYIYGKRRGKLKLNRKVYIPSREMSRRRHAEGGKGIEESILVNKFRYLIEWSFVGHDRGNLPLPWD